jgi:phospholipase C
MSSNGPAAIDPIVVLMLENRSFDHLLGFPYAGSNSVSPAGRPFDGLSGQESNTDGSGKAVAVFKIQSTSNNACFMPAANPGEGYSATSSQLFGALTAPTPPQATNQGSVTDFAYTLGWESREGRSISAWHSGRTTSWPCVPGRGRRRSYIKERVGARKAARGHGTATGFR